MTQQFDIDGTTIGTDYPAYIVAEISCNHKQKLEKAVQLIEQAKIAGANAVKMQVYYPQDMTIDSKNHWFKIDSDTPWDGQYLHDLYVEGSTPYPWASKLKTVADKVGITLFSSVFSIEAVDYLEEHVNPPAYKIGSFEINHWQLIERVVKTKKPIIISTGIALLDDLSRAQQFLDARRVEYAILKCTSSYPTPAGDSSLRDIEHLKKYHSCVVGLSDHTSDIYTAIAGVALGAKIIEKHIKLDEPGKALDDAFSLTPKRFSDMVYAIRQMEPAIRGGVGWHTGPNIEKARLLGRSIFVVKDVCRGDVLTTDNLRVIRPGHGMNPWQLIECIGRRATENIKAGTPLTLSMVGEI